MLKVKLFPLNVEYKCTMLCGGILLLFNLGEIRVELDGEHQQNTGPKTKKKHHQEQLQSAEDDGIV